MTVPQQPTRTTHVGNGVTTVFAYDFLCLAKRDLQVIVADVIVDPSLYTVSNLGQGNGGDVTFSAAPANLAQIVIQLDMVLDRETDYQTNGDLFAKTVNFDFDRIWLAIQQAFGFLNRVPRLGDSDVDGAGAYRAKGNRIQDLGAPLNMNDAARKQDIVEALADLSTDGTGQFVIERLADTSNIGNGDELIGVKQPYANAFAITQHFHNLFTQTPFHYHAIGDGEVDDTVAINNTWAACAALGIKCEMQKGKFALYGDLRLRSGLHVVFNSGAELRPKKWSPSGGYVTNLNMASILDSEVDNVLIENLQFDGEDIDRSEIGNSNAFGIARGARNVRVLGATVKNLPYSWNAPGGAGGKAVMVEQGVIGFFATDIWAERCGTAIFIQGVPGAWADGVKKQAVGVHFGHVHAEQCDAAAVFAGVTTDSTNPTGDPDICLALISQITYHNCGHAPTRVIATDHKKSSPIVFAEAQNIRIDNIKGYNDPTYPQVDPGYPTDPSVIGQGLSGPIGAVVWGWGRNISIGTIEHHGDVDSIVHIERARAHGDDAAPSGTPTNVFRFDADEIKHYGTANYALTQGSGFLGPDESMTGRICITTDVLTTGFVGTDWGMANGVYLRFRNANTGAVVEGNPFNVRSFRNTFAGTDGEPYIDRQRVRDLRSDRSYTDTVTIADDGVYVISPRHTAGILSVVSEASLLRVFVGYRCSASGAQTAIMGAAVSNVAVTTGVLTGTTGTDGNFTISADNAGNLYLENRRGASAVVSFGFPG